MARLKKTDPGMRVRFDGATFTALREFAQSNVISSEDAVSEICRDWLTKNHPTHGLLVGRIDEKQ